MKRVGHLWEQMIDKSNMELAILNATRRKRGKKRVEAVRANISGYADELIKLLESGEFVPSPPNTFDRYDGIRGKWRSIASPRLFPDQCIHWAAMQVLSPILMRGFYEHSYASLPGRSNLQAAQYIQKCMRRRKTKYALQIDIRHFYQHIDHDILKAQLAHKVKDIRFLALLGSIIDGYADGLPIGYYTSQWLANFYLTDFDRKVTTDKACQCYVRYMDDMIVLSSNKRALRRLLGHIVSWLDQLGLEVKPNWQIYKTDSRPVDFAGYVVTPEHMRMRGKTFLRFTRRIRKLARKRSPTLCDAQAIMSYLGIVEHVDNVALYRDYITPYVRKRDLRRVIGYAKSSKRYQTCPCAS